MLDSMRRQGASIFIYLIFGILIAIFVINIGPGSGKRGDDAGCTGTTNHVVTVDGSDANETAFHIAYSSPTNRGQGKERTYTALEALIRRELLAAEGTDHGLRVGDDLVDEGIKQGFFYLGGQKISIKDQVFDEHEDGTTTWNIRRFKNWVSQLNVSLGAYRSEQARSMQAAMMGEIIRDTVRVSRDEAYNDYLYENTTVEYDVVAFEPTAYRDAMHLTDADLTRYVAAHEVEVKTKYDADHVLYKTTGAALHLRQIFIAKADEPKPEAPKPDDKKPADKKDDKKPADKKDDKSADKKDDKPAISVAAVKPDAKKPDVKKPVGMSIDAAKAKLEAARTAIAGGKQKFADAAKELATDDAEKATGGDLGWRKVDGPQLGDKALNDAAKALKPGEMTAVIATDRGVFLVMADDKREGDLTFDQVKNEIALTMAKETWSKEAAKRAALKALDTARDSKKNLSALYESDVQMPKPSPGGTHSIPPEELEKIRKQLNLPDNIKVEKHGSITPIVKDELAGWNAGPDGSSGGSAVGSGSAAGSAAAAPVVPAAPVPLAASKEDLPSFGEMPAIKYQHEGPAKRTAFLPGLPTVKEAAGLLFDELADGQLAPHVLEGDGGYYVLQLIKKESPKVEDFDKKADAAMQRLQDARSGSMLIDWMRTRCESLSKAGKIKIAADKTHETDDQGKPLPQTYTPCYQLRVR